MDPAGVPLVVDQEDPAVPVDPIPVVFALSRNKLGKAMGKPMTLSIVGLYDVDGVNEEYKAMLKKFLFR